MYPIYNSAPRLLVIAFITAGLFTFTPALALESDYSDTGKGCDSLHSDHEARAWRCPGPGGYAAVFSDEGNVIEVEYGKLGHEKNLGGLKWQGSDTAVGPKIEWRVKRNTPYAAILRVGTVNGNGRAVVQLLVAKVTPDGGCRMALVDASKHGANIRARLIADTRAIWFRCSRT